MNCYLPEAESYLLQQDTIEDLNFSHPIMDDAGCLPGMQLSDKQQGNDENPSCE
jgi:hypothetical protein